MIHTADGAYLALGDYRNGAVAWRSGQFVLITEPELIPALERDGGMALLQPVSRAAFLGKAAQATKAEPAPATEPQAEEPVAEELTPEPTPNQTVAAGKPRGSNRMATGTHSQSRRRQG